MFGTQPELVLALREMARDGVTPSAMLRHLLAHHPEADRNVFVQYFSEAFCFADGEGYPIFGWFPDGTGELANANLDHLLTKRIQRTRPVWDSAAAENRLTEEVRP
jgi:hypothetical protein